MSLPLDIDIRSFLEGVPHPAMILNQSFKIIALNSLMEAMTGYDCEKVVGIYGELVVRSNTGNCRGQLYKRVLKTGQSVSVTGDVINSYRRKIDIQYSLAPLCDTSGDRCAVLIVVEDLSPRNRDNKVGSRSFNSIELIGHSPKMQKVFDMIPLLAQTDASVMITGETGTGKDKIAEIIHQNSPRARFPFIKINCGALPPGLLESELFGHVKGAFTGATRNKQGMFKLADKGTFFLTEIGDMPTPLQIKLLSVLDDKEFVPVGGESKLNVDVRIIAATHRPLRNQVQNNQFREDLFYRLNVLHIHLPPLRERNGDVRYLLDHFLQRFTKPLNKTISGFAPAAMQILLEYNYPGNIRELSNIVEYTANICGQKEITTEHLPPYLLERQPQQEPLSSKTDSIPSMDCERVDPPDQHDQRVGSDDQASWGDIERQMIIESLIKCRGNKTKTAESLGWGRMKLWRKMKKYDLME